MNETFIRLYENRVEQPICKSIIEAFNKESGAQHSGLTRVGQYKTPSPVKKTTDSYIIGEPQYAEFRQILYRAFQECFHDYTNEFSKTFLTSFGDIHHDTGYKIGRYTRNEDQYDYHVDSWGTDINRTTAALLYLNDVAEGGGTHFPYQDARVQPKAGNIVVFPAFYPWLHAGERPLSGDKYIVNTFFFSEKIPAYTSADSPVLSPKDYFSERLPYLLQGGPVKAFLDWPACFAFKISGPRGGNWYLDVRQDNFEIKTERDAPVDVTLSLSDENFVQLANGKLRPETAFLSGQMQFEGNIGVLLRLAYLFPNP